LQYSRTGSSRHRGHIEACESCRTLVMGFRMLRGERAELLESPSAEALAGYKSIPQTVADRPARARVSAGLAYDSWSDRPQAALRDFPIGQVRTLTWRRGDIEVEIVGHRELSTWQFTARVYVGRRILSACSLTVGRRVVLPGIHGFMMWKHSSPPKKLLVRTTDEILELEAVSW